MNGANMATNVQGRDYSAWSLSADWRVSGATTIGILHGRATDKTAFNADVKQTSLIASHTLSRRTMLYSTLTKLQNSNGGTFSLGAAAPSRATHP